MGVGTVSIRASSTYSSPAHTGAAVQGLFLGAWRRGILLSAFVDGSLTVKFADGGFRAGVVMGVGTGTGWRHGRRGQEAMFQLGGGKEGVDEGTKTGGYGLVMSVVVGVRR